MVLGETDDRGAVLVRAADAEALGSDPDGIITFMSKVRFGARRERRGNHPQRRAEGVSC